MGTLGGDDLTALPERESISERDDREKGYQTRLLFMLAMMGREPSGVRHDLDSPRKYALGQDVDVSLADGDPQVDRVRLKTRGEAGDAVGRDPSRT